MILHSRAAFPLRWQRAKAPPFAWDRQQQVATTNGSPDSHNIMSPRSQARGLSGPGSFEAKLCAGLDSSQLARAGRPKLEDLNLLHAFVELRPSELLFPCLFSAANCRLPPADCLRGAAGRPANKEEASRRRIECRRRGPGGEEGKEAGSLGLRSGKRMGQGGTFCSAFLRPFPKRVPVRQLAQDTHTKPP